MRAIVTALLTLALASCGSALKVEGKWDGESDADRTDGLDVSPVDPARDVPPEPILDTTPEPTADPVPDPVTEPPDTACTPASTITCTTSLDGSNDGAGSTHEILRNGCYDNEWTGPEISYALTFPDHLRARFDLTGLSGDLDMFLFEQVGGWCDPFSCLDASLSGERRDERIVYVGDPGQTVYLMIDGWDGAVSNFHLDVGCVTPEDCDDGLDNDGDTVTDCDDPECRWVLPCYEDVCDDDIDNDHDGPVDCDDFDCMSLPECPTACTPTATVECGNTYRGDTRLTGTTDDVDRWSCATWDESGPEDIVTFVAPRNTRVTVRIFDHSVDLDVFILEDNGSGCVNTNCITHHNNTASFDAAAGSTYYFVIDGYMGVSGDYGLEISCS